MFGNKVARGGMQASSEEAREEEVKEGLNPEGFDEQSVENELSGDVEIMPLCQSLGPHKAWTQSVEDYLEGPGGG